MKMKLELTEDEMKQALADWAAKRQGMSVSAKDVSFALDNGDSDPRCPRGPHIASATIVISGLPIEPR